MKKERGVPNAVMRRVCDYMWGTVIVLRDKICAYCKSNPASQAHHMLCKKDCPATRYSLKVGIGLCAGCHKFKAHGNPEMYRNFNIEHVGGEAEYEALKSEARREIIKRDWEEIERSLWLELAHYNVFKPIAWGDWKEYKKIEYLRECRRFGGKDEDI